MSDLPHILVVDDEPINIEIILELLSEEDLYQITTAEDGDIALKIMMENPEQFDAVLLDRMMPKIDGMEVLKQMKKHPILKYCPVIFQTAKVANIDIAEGLEAGAYYYLTKPFDAAVLLSVLNTAVRDGLRFKQALADLDKNQNLMMLLRSAYFEFKSIDDARSLAALLSHAFPDPAKVVMGLTELMINAVEHGNLEITYDEKSHFNEQGIWCDETNRRLALSEFANRKVDISIERSHKEVKVTISDHGKGFDWQKYMDFDPQRVMDNHGRGIAIANKLSFSTVDYSGNGNQVCATVKLD